MNKPGDIIKGMGRLKIKRKKDWRDKFKKPQPRSFDSDSLGLNLVSPSDRVKDKLDEPSSEPQHEQLTLQERSLYLIDAATNIFDLSRLKWDEIRRTISPEQVREFYSVVADLWHPKTDIVSLLPNPSSELRAMYFGNLDPAYFSRNIYRYSLYADQIFITDPFHKPHILKDEYNPLIHPAKYKADTIKLLHFVLDAESWIRAGLVTLVPDPGDFDFEFRDEALRLAKERSKGFQFSKQDTEDNSKEGREDFRRFILRLPKKELEGTIRKAHPGISESKVEEVYQYLIDRRKRDPLALDQTIEGRDDQITAVATGGNLETVQFLSEEIGAFPYTSLKWRWRELLSQRHEMPEVAEVWSPLTHAFQELEFKFLDNVDSQFAYEMRTDGRLDSFRTFLRRTWKTVGGEARVGDVDTLSREFSDELLDEYRRAKSEWSRIDTDLVKWVGASVVGGLVSGHLSFVSPLLAMLGVAGVGTFKLIESYRKRKEFRSRLPMSVFVDLSTHSPQS